MSETDAISQIAYRQAVGAKLQEVIAFVLEGDRSATSTAIPYSQQIILAFADAAAKLKTPLNTVIAYLLFTESNRAISSSSVVQRIFSSEARSYYGMHKKLADAGAKLMATYAPDPVDQELYGMFLDIAYSYWFEHQAQAMGVQLGDSIDPGR